MSAIARVALDTPVDRLFDYQALDACVDDIGRRVEVSFGPRTLVGVLVELAEHTEVAPAALKALKLIDRDTPPLPGELLALARFASGYYHHSLGAVLASLLPPALRRGGRPSLQAAAPAAYTLNDAGRSELARIDARKPAQLALARRFLAADAALLRADLSDREKALLRDWSRRGWLDAGAVVADTPLAASMAPEPTAEQEAVLGHIRAAGAGFSPWLLHGVTGSGKTEVYLRLVADTLARGRQALILVPEIHLTPQLGERFARRFPGYRLIGLHSGLSSGERRAGWLAALHGEADIILGTRLAVFTPMPRLGLIVVDEEHDTSYKQMEGMRYSARDIAVWRARQAQVPVLLGSATPALETWNNARAGRYRLLTLGARAHAQASLPQVRLVDSRTDRPQHGLSRALTAALDATLQRGEQSLVFINRRGYAPTLSCNGCGHVFPCTRCSAHLVLHREGHGYRLVCHHCGLNTRPPEACPVCGSVDLRPAGQGTQRLEETLAERFPDARILRIDRDSASRRGAFAAMRERVAAREVDILVGTQIVAKGHDFPHLTLVGVIGADQALVSPDFRASERLFAQLMQVAGRAGRAEHPGLVLIQTRYPGHPLYQSVVRHDYPGFASAALSERRAADFPPYVAQAVLRAEANTEEAALAYLMAAREIGQAMAQARTPGGQSVEIFDPVPALMPRVANRHRLQLLLQSGNRRHLQAFLGPWLEALSQLPARGAKWTLDVDPVDV